VMAGGIVPWIFSPVLFHTEMSVMLVLLMAANLIVGLFILPAFIAWVRPRFLTRFEPTAPGARQTAAVAEGTNRT
jgi:predicted RND superfamily exporter protein